MIVRKNPIFRVLSRIRGPQSRAFSHGSRHLKENQSHRYSLANNVGNGPKGHENRSDEVLSLEKTFKNRSIYFKLPDYYHKEARYVPSDTDIKSYKPLESFERITYYSENNIPSSGSLVEYISPGDNNLIFGVVLNGPSSRFNERTDKILVLNQHGETAEVSPTDITFHLFRVLRQNWIEELDITKNAFGELSWDVSNVVRALKQFLHQSAYFASSIEEQMQVCYSRYAQAYNIGAVTLPEVADSLDLSPFFESISQSYFDQSSFLFACHINLVNSPNWFVPSYLVSQRVTNLIAKECSNLFVSAPMYFTNSLYNTDAINRYLNDRKNDKKLKNINSFLEQLVKLQLSAGKKSFDELNFYFNIWQGRDYRFVIDVLKYAIVYPHLSILSSLSSLTVLEPGDLTPKSIYDFLTLIGLYNNEKNQMTDIYLSANIAGKPYSSQLAVSSVSELETQSMVRSSYTHLNDMTPFIRGTKRYYRDHVIYGIPFTNYTSSGLKFSSLGISLEKVNSRKYLLNLHIPDIMTKLSPSSNIFDQISTISSSMKSIKRLLDSGSINIFDNKFLEEVMFPQHCPEKQMNELSAGEFNKKRYERFSPVRSCLTLTFTYMKYDSNPFAEINDRINFSFDDISNVVIKNLDLSQLEDALKGRSEISPFRLLIQRSKRNDQDTTGKVDLDHDDLHNINFIYHVMKSHYKLRNLNGATDVHQTKNRTILDISSLRKELSYTHDDFGNETLNTKLVDDMRTEDKPESTFLINELDKFAGNLTSIYCHNNKIPVFARYHGLMDDSILEIEGSTDDNDDQVFVEHDNFLLPNFHASSFHQLLLSRDSYGLLSNSTNVTSKSFLTQRTLCVQGETSDSNVPMGLKHGYVSFCDALNSYEAMMNQLQILFFAIAASKQGNFITNLKSQSYLKRYGYNLNGPYPVDVLKGMVTSLNNSNAYSELIESLNRRFVTLVYLQQSLNQSEAFTEENRYYECIITHVGGANENNETVCKAYCVNIDLEINLILSSRREAKIGSVVDCATIHHIEPISGICILRESRIL